MTRHICFIAPYVYPSLVPGTGLKFAGGAELQQALIGKLLVHAGFRVSMLCRDFGQPERVVAEGVELYRIPSHETRGIPGLRWLWPRLTDVAVLLHELNPDVVYVRTCTAFTTPAAWYARRHQKRFIFNSASDKDFASKRDRSMSLRDWALYRLGLRWADMLLAQHPGQAAAALQNLGRSSTVSPNFLDQRPGLSSDRSGPIIWVGSISPVKRPLVFVDLARKMPHRQFVMVGGAQVGEAGRVLMEEVRREAVGVANLTLKGHVPAAVVGREFDGAAVLINTSESEGFPNTFLEAWARGVPTLSFLSPQSAEGERGSLACKDLDDMARRLSALVDDEPLWEAQRQRVIGIHQRYHTCEAASARLVGVFSSLCAS